jgi:hypothetical protein
MQIEQMLQLPQLPWRSPQAPGAAAVLDQLNGRGAQSATYGLVQGKSSPLNSTGSSSAMVSPLLLQG